MLVPTLLCLLASAPSASAAPDDTPLLRSKLWLQFPATGLAAVVRSDPPPMTGVTRETSEITILGVSFAVDLAARWTFELGAAIVDTAGGLRAQAALRSGPLFTLLDRRRPDGVGPLLQLAPLASIAYRSEAASIGAGGGQTSVSVGAAAGLEYTHFKSRTRGWTIRARPTFSYAVHREGNSLWSDHEDKFWWSDGYLMQVGINFDVGMVF